MNYILVMSLSGSIFFLIYLVLRMLLRNTLPAGWYKRMLKINLLYALLPLPFLKELYHKIWLRFKQTGEALGNQIFWHDEMILFVDEGDILLNETAKRESILFGVWISGTAVVGLLILVYYMSKRRKMVGLMTQKIHPKYEEIVKEICNKLKFRKQVQVILCEGNISPFTLGFFKPIIFCADMQKESEQKLILEHEMVHIKCRDSLWRYIGLLAVVMHWYNPIIWLLKGEFARISEYACDEQVLQNKTVSECKQYLELILAYASTEKEELLSVSLSKDGKEVERRMKNILRKRRKLSATVSTILLALVVWINSFTVLAYEDVKVARGEVFMDGSCVESDFLFIEDGQEAPAGISFINEYQFYFDAQFIDEEGNVYDVTEENVNTYAACSHTYVNGQYQQHTKNNSGGCTVYVYSAKRCSKCGNVIDKVLINTFTYGICTH